MHMDCSFRDLDMGCSFRDQDMGCSFRGMDNGCRFGDCFSASLGAAVGATLGTSRGTRGAPVESVCSLKAMEPTSSALAWVLPRS